MICNDVFAYIWGKIECVRDVWLLITLSGITVGRTPLIKLSPKKTVEGFVGAFFSTLLFSVAVRKRLLPPQGLELNAFNSGEHCS